MRTRQIVLAMMLCFTLPASAQVSVSVGFQAANIGLSLSTYPNLVRVPGYPVYYASGVNSNYFFYDGMYWVFETDRWYSSSWYNGPWMMVDPEFIPLYLLRVPVRYYRRPPAFFVGWHGNSPPRWHDHWGHEWAQRRSGWDRWDRRAMPAPAPLPTYQRQYSGDRYPSRDQQPILQQRNYRHEARDPLVRQQSQAASPPPRSQPEPARRGREESQQRRNPEPSAAPPRSAPAVRQETPAAPRVDERPAPRDNLQRQREPNRENMRPQAEPNQQRGQPSNEVRPALRQPEAGQHPGQRSGQQRERDDSDERGQGRGR